MTKRLLVTGSRNWTLSRPIREAIDKYTPGMIIQGGAEGADQLAAEIAEWLGIPYATFDAHWDKFGKRAGPIRNQAMLDIAEPTQVVAFVLPGSIGTLDMIRRAREAGIPVEVYNNEDG